MKRFVSFFFKALALLVYFLTYIFPRKKSRWLFGEANGFNNNSKYLFLEIIELHPEIEAYWIGDKSTVGELREKGFPAYTRYSLKGIFLCLFSKVYVVSWTTADINFYLSGGAFVVNLWHGLAWKKCLWLEPKNAKYEKASFFRRFFHAIENPVGYFHPDLVLSTSDFYTEVYAKMFKVRTAQCVEDIYPRVKYMLKSKEEITNQLSKYREKDYIALIDEISKYKKTFLYAPTYRDNGVDFIKMSGIDFFEIDERLQKESYFMIVKFHPGTKLDVSQFSSFKNIILLSKKYDLNIIMPFTDVLITDYSTTLTDYMLLNKSMIAFVFDYDEYIHSCRDLLFPFEECIKGVPIAHNVNELLRMMFDKSDELLDIPQNLVERYWKPSGNLIDRIRKEIAL